MSQKLKLYVCNLPFGEFKNKTFNEKTSGRYKHIEDDCNEL